MVSLCTEHNAHLSNCTSPRDYFWATAALYGFSWFARVIRTFFNGVPSGVTYEALPGDMVKITVPTKVSWRAGQHFFIRFLDLGIHAASSHPFTVASLPAASDKGGLHTIELYARVQGGITARLDAIAKSNRLKISSVLLDGPYGGLEGNLRVYDRALLLGGGSGMSSPGRYSDDNLNLSPRHHVCHSALPRPYTLL